MPVYQVEPRAIKEIPFEHLELSGGSEVFVSAYDLHLFFSCAENRK
jgi:hypothetical protein